MHYCILHENTGPHYNYEIIGWSWGPPAPSGDAPERKFFLHKLFYITWIITVHKLV